MTDDGADQGDDDDGDDEYERSDDGAYFYEEPEPAYDEPEVAPATADAAARAELPPRDEAPAAPVTPGERARVAKKFTARVNRTVPAAAQRAPAPRKAKPSPRAKPKLGYESIEDRYLPTEDLADRVRDKLNVVKWPSVFDGSRIGDKSYQGIRSELYASFAKRRIVDTDNPVAGKQSWPDLSNGELIALTRSWKRAAARSSAPSWPISYDLFLSGLGWRKEGDQFRGFDAATKGWPKEPASAAAIQLFWIATGELAEQLDGSGTRLYPLIVDWSFAAYQQQARDAWHEMQMAKLPPMPDPTPPIDPVLPVAPSLGGDGSLLLLLLLAFLATRKR